ncbi:hypothetical protein ACQ4PT_013025 [Festuca glaucescens]
MHGGSTFGRSSGDRDGEARGFQHGAGSVGRSAADGDGEQRARGFQLGQHGPGSSGLRAGDGDGEWRARGIQLDQHGRGPSGLLGQLRGSTSASTAASAWTTSGWNGATKPPLPPPRDVSEKPGSSRQDASYLASLMVAHFIEMGFPAEKVAMALEHAGRGGGGGDKEADVLQWLLDQKEGSSRQGTAHLTSPMATHFTGMGFSAEEVAMALEHAGGGRDEEAVVLQWLLDHQETDLEGFSSSIDLEGFSSSSGDLEVISSPTDLETFDEELTESDKFFKLVEMGFTSNQASAAITTCGADSMHQGDKDDASLCIQMTI